MKFERVTQARADIALAAVEAERAEHVKWRDYWLSIPDHDDCEGCKEDEERVGSLEFHREAIAGLDTTIFVLKRVDSTLNKKRRWWQRGVH